MTTRESIELFAILLGISVAFIIHFGFGEKPSIESSTPRFKPALEFDFNRPERRAAVRAPAGPSPVRKRRSAAKPAPTPAARPTSPVSSPSESPGYQAPSTQTPAPPAARQPSSGGKSPSSGRKAPAGGGAGARFDDSG